MAQTVKRLPAVRETRVLSLGWEDPLEKEMATHSNTLVWKIPWTEEPGRLQFMGLQRVRHDWATSRSRLDLRCVMQILCCGARTLVVMHQLRCSTWRISVHLLGIESASPALHGGFFFFFLQSGFLIAGQPGKSPAYFKGLKNQKYVLGPTFFHIYKQILM